MKKLILPLLSVVLLSSLSASAQVPFTAGNIVVCRLGAVGNPGLTTNATPTFLDEYTSTGLLVQSIAMPITLGAAGNPANKILTNNGAVLFEGMITLSGDRKYIVVAGYNAVPGTANISTANSTTVNRVVGMVDVNAAINTTTALTDFNSAGSASPKSAASSDGTNIWITGNGTSVTGIRYTTLGSSTSVQLNAVTSHRVLNVVNGQLYVSTISPPTSISEVGLGLPSTGTPTINPIATTASPYQYIFADMNPGITGVDVMYVCDDNATSGGIKKFSYDGSLWILNGVVGVASDAYRGLTGILTGSSMQLFAIRKSTNTAAGGGELVTITDGSGHNGAITGTPTLLTTASTNTVFRGVSLVPEGAACTGASISSHPLSISVCHNTSTILSVNASGTGPFNYQWYQGNSGDISSPVGGNSNIFTTPSLISSTNYWVKVTGACGGSVNSNTATVNIYSSATWTGSVNNDFNIAGNWSTNCVPTSSMSIIIPSGNSVITGGTILLLNLTIQAGALLSLNDGAILGVAGDCINNGTVVSAGSPSNGKMVLNGTGIQSISGIGTFSNVEISNTVGVNAISDLSIYNLLVLPGAIFTINSPRILTILH